MRQLRITIVCLIIMALVGGAILNNIWRLTPEFHELDAIFNVPLYVQIILIFTTIFIGFLIFGKKGKIWHIPVFIIISILLMASWYNVNISNSINSFIIRIDPFYKKILKFDDVGAIRFSKYKILLLTKSKKAYPIVTGVYPIGLNRKMMDEALNGFGNCIRKMEDGRCRKIEFEWP